MFDLNKYSYASDIRIVDQTVFDMFMLTSNKLFVFLREIK